MSTPRDTEPPASDPAGPGADPEAQAVAERYARRAQGALPVHRYSMLRADVWQSAQERQRAMIRLFVRLGWTDLSRLRLLEVGCAGGANLQELLRLGFAPQHLGGIELLADRLEQARASLPSATVLHLADATRLSLPPATQDIVLVSTVFSSLLDDAFQQRLADAIWGWVRPGGGVLWYDFIRNNPRNPDVRGVPVGRVRALFPLARVSVQRVTLAPPIARAVTRVHPHLYTLCNLPPLRSHVLAWVGRPA
jgi:SAM-dependent methyltransferase